MLSVEPEDCYQNLRFRDFFSASAIISKKWDERIFSFSKTSSASEICRFRPERDIAEESSPVHPVHREPP